MEDTDNQTLVNDLWQVLSSVDDMNPDSIMLDSFMKPNVPTHIDITPALSPVATVPVSPAYTDTSDYASASEFSPRGQPPQASLEDLLWLGSDKALSAEQAVAELASQIDSQAMSQQQSYNMMPQQVPQLSQLTQVPQRVPQASVQSIPQAIPIPETVHTAFKVKDEPVSPSHCTAQQKTGGRPRRTSQSKILTTTNTRLDEEELTLLPVRELNKRLQGCARDEILKIKQKRRTLKNRGYAQNCRTKRMNQRSELEEENHILNRHLDSVKIDLDHALRELALYKSKYESLRQRTGSESTLPSSPESILF